MRKEPDFKQVHHPGRKLGPVYTLGEVEPRETYQKPADYDPVLRSHCRMDEPRVGPAAPRHTNGPSSTPWG
jgi:hypothetical protein